MNDEGQLQQFAPCRRWMWSGLLAEISKPFVGVTYALVAFTESIHSMVAGIHGDLVAHHNHAREQDTFRTEVMRELETYREI